jgi:uncharacterized membrane protein YphA (DoxX/SURF4 family)
MKNIYYALLAGVFFVPSLVSAHVKWFVDSEDVIASSHNSVPFYSLASKEVFIWILISLAIIFVVSIIDRNVKTPKKLLAFGVKHESIINRVSQVILGLFLISVSFLWQIVIIPEAQVVDTLTRVLQYVQVAVGLLFVFNIKPRIASALLALFCFGLIFSHGYTAFFENAVLLALAVYFFIVHSEKGSYAFEFRKYGVEIVRVGAGVSLIVLAFTEKFLFPELSLTFLAEHHWNFMQPLFPWFTNELFVLSTGFAEMIFGVLFILGYMTRVTTIAIAVFFACSVVTMALQSSAWEVEDLVIYSVAVLLLFFGHREFHIPLKLKKSK